MSSFEPTAREVMEAYNAVNPPKKLMFTLNSKVRTRDGRKAGIYWIGVEIHGWFESRPGLAHMREICRWPLSGLLQAVYGDTPTDLILIPEHWLLFDKYSEELIKEGDEYWHGGNYCWFHVMKTTPKQTVNQSGFYLIRRRVEP